MGRESELQGIDGERARERGEWKAREINIYIYIWRESKGERREEEREIE